jgi:hypothetical protein
MTQDPNREADLINQDGDQYWYRNGKRHRDGDQPAMICSNGSQHWYRNGKRHRDGDLPAVTYTDGKQQWYQNGEQLDVFYPNFGCFRPVNRAEALERLSAKFRPYSRHLYMELINKEFPE